MPHGDRWAESRAKTGEHRDREGDKKRAGEMRDTRGDRQLKMKRKEASEQGGGRHYCAVKLQETSMKTKEPPPLSLT